MMQGYDVNFRPCTETEGNECAADAEADIKPAPVFSAVGVRFSPTATNLTRKSPSSHCRLEASKIPFVIKVRTTVRTAGVSRTSSLSKRPE